jgi:hypothetical protein
MARRSRYTPQTVSACWFYLARRLHDEEGIQANSLQEFRGGVEASRNQNSRINVAIVVEPPNHHYRVIIGAQGVTFLFLIERMRLSLSPHPHNFRL